MTKLHGKRKLRETRYELATKRSLQTYHRVHVYRTTPKVTPMTEHITIVHQIENWQLYISVIDNCALVRVEYIVTKQIIKNVTGENSCDKNSFRIHAAMNKLRRPNQKGYMLQSYINKC